MYLDAEMRNPGRPHAVGHTKAAVWGSAGTTDKGQVQVHRRGAVLWRPDAIQLDGALRLRFHLARLEDQQQYNSAGVVAATAATRVTAHLLMLQKTCARCLVAVVCLCGHATCGLRAVHQEVHGLDKRQHLSTCVRASKARIQIEGMFRQ